MVSNVLAYRGFRMEASDAQLASFVDRADIASWARTGVATAVREEIFQGKPGQVFDPAGFLTRAEAAVALMGLLNAR